MGNRVIGLYEINVPTAASIMQANNLYAYCGNTPFVYIDPSGEIAITTIILIGSIVVGTVAVGYQPSNVDVWKKYIAPKLQLKEDELVVE